MIIYGSIKEWKESPHYLFAKWFDDLNKDIQSWFKTDTYTDLEYDYFEYDSTHHGPIYVGNLYFNEADIQWKLQIILDSNELNEDDTIDEITIQLHGYDKKGGKETNDHIGELKREITEPEFTPDLIFELISEFKDQYIDVQTETEEGEEEIETEE